VKIGRKAWGINGAGGGKKGVDMSVSNFDDGESLERKRFNSMWGKDDQKIGREQS